MIYLGTTLPVRYRQDPEKMWDLVEGIKAESPGLILITEGGRDACPPSTIKFKELHPISNSYFY